MDEFYFPYVEQKKVTPRLWRVGSSSHHLLFAPVGARIPSGKQSSSQELSCAPALCSHQFLGKPKAQKPHKPLRGLHPTPGDAWQDSCWDPLPAPLKPTPACSLGKRPWSLAEVAGAGSGFFTPKLFAGGGRGCTSSWRNHHAKNNARLLMCSVLLNPLDKCTSMSRCCMSTKDISPGQQHHWDIPSGKKSIPKGH